MLRSLKELKGFRIDATDGELGSVRDLLFDDEQWTVRYVVAATGPWLLGKRVLIGWPALGQPDWEDKTFPVSLTKAQVKHSPHVSTDEPVSRRQERALRDHYGWSPYWGAAMAKVALRDAGLEPDEPDPEDETHLRSVREVVGYDVRARDELVGTVADFLVDDRSWIIRKMIVEDGTLFSKSDVLVDASWIDEVDWARRVVTVGLDKARLDRAAAPENSNTSERYLRPVL